jgi:hypothetical protein
MLRGYIKRWTSGIIYKEKAFLYKAELLMSVFFKPAGWKWRAISFTDLAMIFLTFMGSKYQFLFHGIFILMTKRWGIRHKLQACTLLAIKGWNAPLDIGAGWGEVPMLRNS